MRILSRSWMVGAVLVASFSATRGAEADQSPKYYIVLPVTTDFQRSSIGKNTTAYAEVNSTAIAHDGKVDASAFNIAEFQAELKKLAEEQAGDLMLYFRFSGTSGQTPEAKLLEAAVRQSCRDAGFKNVRQGQSYGGNDWEQRIGIAQAASAGEAAVDELPLSNKLVRAYPIRSPLSQLLAGDCNCYVELKQPIDGREKEFSQETIDSIAECITKLELPHRQRIVLQVMSTKAGEPILEEFLRNKQSGPSQSDLFAKKLGFETCGIRHSPCGGAPESLIGLTSPDFKLDALEGEPIQLQEAIRGKVALIAFWGVACGPCCVEAPHLSALYEKYKDDGFTVISVNAYNESKETVEGFVRRAKLKQPIALQGQKTATNEYKVRAYPTCFWVDHTGKVVDYKLDFNEGDERELTAAVERMLADRNK